MKGANQSGLAVAALPGDNALDPMSADIVEGVYDPVPPPHDERSFPCDVEGAPISGSGNVRDVAGELPMAEE